MKTLKERILEILIDKIKCSGYTAIEGIPQSAREIESLIKENYVEKIGYERVAEQNRRMREWFKHRTGLSTNFLQAHMMKVDNMLNGWYPKEFVEWSHFLKDKGTIFHNPDGLFSLGDFDLTIDELYEYWKTEVNNSKQ